MEIRKVSISQINPAPYNPRKDLQKGDLEYEKLAKSIEVFGQVEPLVWNERSGNLVGGHQRFKILSAKGQEEFLVSVVDLDETAEKQLNIALNKISGQWDEEKLNALLEELAQEAAVELTGFDEAELEHILRTADEIDFSDFFIDAEPKAAKPKTVDAICPECGHCFKVER